jgi:hypothetical protein
MQFPISIYHYFRQYFDKTTYLTKFRHFYYLFNYLNIFLKW